MDTPGTLKPEQHGFVRAGDLIDNCRIEELLGSGAFGAVYRAHHVALDQPRAFKFLVPRSGITDEHKHRFLSEARHTARLGHPNIVIVHNVGEFRGLPFIHMECLGGASLRAALGHGRLATDEALRIIDQVLAALAAAHAKSLVHRDVKPENVMVLEAGGVKVVDFGLSVNVEATTRLTVASDQILGTPLYMAPEQWQTNRVGPPADVWSAGVMLYEMLAGQAPFRGQNLLQLMYAVQNLAHSPLREAAPGVPDSLLAVVDRMLAKTAADRFPDAAEARLAVRTATQRRPVVSSSSFQGTEWMRADAVAFPENLVGLPVGPDRINRFRRPCDGATMFLLNGGTCSMGSDNGDPDERPRHPVQLSPFLLDEAPVTSRQFANFLSLWGSDRDDEGHPLLDPEVAGLERVGMCWEPGEDESAPVRGVTWHGAVAYARWAGMHLPSEAQLEYAFRHAVDRLPNLLGAVRHWCADTYDEGFYVRSPEFDPVNTDPGSFVAVRGRSCLPAPNWSPSCRHFAAPHEKFLDVGFRGASTTISRTLGG